MGRRDGLLVLLLGPVLARVCLAAGPSAAAALDVGDRAPDVSLPATKGANVSLSQFRGKKLVLIASLPRGLKLPFPLLSDFPDLKVQLRRHEPSCRHWPRPSILQ
jgi:hypothetical protein